MNEAQKPICLILRKVEKNMSRHSQNLRRFRPVKKGPCGQRQAVALTRALPTGADFLLLDEPTAGLDQDTERGIIECLLPFCEDKTLVVCTHSLELLKKMDRLIVVQDGRILADD